MPNIEEIHDLNNPGSTDLAAYDVTAYAFLEEYKKDLDADRAAKTLGIPRKKYQEWLLQPKFTDVMNRIHQAYADAVLMDAKTIAGWSVEILRDLHQSFKNGNDKASSALATMAGNMLRASGNFKETGVSTPQVLIQINTSGQQTAQEVKEITPTKTQNQPALKSELSINISTNKNDAKERISSLPILCGTQQRGMEKP